MSEFHIVEARPHTDWVYDSANALDVAVSLDLVAEDQSLSAEWLRASFADERNALKGLLLALPGPAPAGAVTGRLGLPEAPADAVEVLGSLTFGLPMRDNRHLMDDVYVQVGLGARRAGIGSALWREARRIAGDRQRTSVIGWTQHLAGAAADAEQVIPPTGVGSVPVDRATRFAQSLGLQLAQVERESRLFVPVDPDLLARLRAEAETRALPEYEVVSWVGPVPQEYLEHVAEMNRTLSVDAPTGDLEWEEEAWDAERVRHSDEVYNGTGYGVASLALHAGTGAVAGYTRIQVHNAHPHRPEQWNTAVAAAHRGHRLGMLLKVINLQQLAATTQEARFVETWNAGENDYMLAINTALGFSLHSMVGGWKFTIAPGG